MTELIADIQPRAAQKWRLPAAYGNGYLKRSIDLAIGIIAFIIFLPVMIYAAIRVKGSSAGPVFYRQERIGRNGHPFNIIKFRSMIPDAEKDGPMLSSPEDSRITPWGRVMRKFRIDELPQLWNVIRGDMSLVGPRPERAYYIRQITVNYPEYVHLLDIKPGLTGWGMVRFGYAENIREMVTRMQFDLDYVRSASLREDLRIMWHTFRIILLGTGK